MYCFPYGSKAIQLFFNVMDSSKRKTLRNLFTTFSFFEGVEEDFNSKSRIWSRMFFAVLSFFSDYRRKRKTCPDTPNPISEQYRLANNSKQATEQYGDSPPSDGQTDSIIFDKIAVNGEVAVNGNKIAVNGNKVAVNGKVAAGHDTKLHHNLQHRQLFSRLHNYVLKDRYYAKPDINRDELIAALSTNRTTLSEAVKAFTNNTLMAYINNLRLEEAKRILDTHPELTIEAIAEKCGFNLRTFHRLFIERYHTTPAKYRQASLSLHPDENATI